MSRRARDARAPFPAVAVGVDVLFVADLKVLLAC
jgi:hypothetical protein